MKKNYWIVSLILFCSISSVYAQDEYPGGSPIGRIFADYKYSVNENDDYNGFDVTRAWLGYKFLLDENFSAQVLVDIGSPLSTPDVSSKRYSFLRNAFISYKKDKLTLSFGLTDERAAATELKLWGKRYLSRPFLLNYKFVNIADLGFIADYAINDIIKVDAAILNGEGYGKVEMDNSLQYALGITLTPVKGLMLRAYGDTYSRPDQGTKNTLSATAGYSHSKFLLAAGYNYKSDFDWTDGHDTDGFTVFGGYNITPKLELFGRYDKLKSVIPEGDADPWNLSKDGSLFIAGLQYRFMKQLKVSFNYQGWTPADETGSEWDYLQFNAEFRF